MIVLHVYGMILQWIGVMQHQLRCVAPEGQHVSSICIYQAINGRGSLYLRLHTN